VIKDNPNPTYNEELYFRLPILKKKLSLEDRLNQKTEESLLHDAIREELKTRPDITINLWLDG
jgi:centrosomal protein CEP76